MFINGIFTISIVLENPLNQKTMKTTILLIFVILLFGTVQAQTSKFITELTPGNLITTMTTEELNTVTFLAISGSMDARDFKTIRDKMPKLEELDLWNVTVAGYKGLQGTSTIIGEPVQDITYPVNAIPQYAFFQKTSIKSVNLPSSVTIICDNAFSDCENLLTINNIPPSLSAIQVASFSNCKSLRSFNIPAPVEDIGYMAFGGSGAVISVDEQNLHYAALDGVLFSKDQTILISCPVSKSGKYDIPENVKTIADGAFLGCKNLTSVYIPTSVTHIGNLAFYECSGLRSITIPYFITSIGFKTFMYCSNLDTVYLPINLTTINSYAFSYCNNLSSFNFPSSVTFIGDNVFENSTQLTVIYARPLKPVELTSNIFRWVDKSKCTLYVPKESVDLYKAAPYWKDFLNMEGVLTSIDLQMDASVSIYPNPFTGSFTIRNGNRDKGLLSIEIINQMGQTILRETMNGNTDHRVDLEKYPSGIYYLRMNSEDGRSTCKLLKR